MLAVKSEVPAINWDALVEEFCQRILEAEREGTPAIVLRDVAEPDADENFDVEGLRLLKRHPVIAFGDGGAAKSLTGLYLGGRLEQRGFGVLFCDWEFSPEDHRVRLRQLFGEDMPGIRYVRCERPLVYEADRITKIVRDSAIDYAIFDSIAFACDGPPESAEVASAYFRAVRQIGVGSLHIAHVTKGDHSDRKPFGSSFWHNGARGTWYVKPTETAIGDDLTIGLFNRKTNVGPLRPPVGYRINFDDGRTTYTRIDVADVSDLASELKLWQRIKRLIASKPLKLVEIAEELSAPVDSVSKAVDRKKTVFTKVHGDDGVYRVALLENRRVA